MAENTTPGSDNLAEGLKDRAAAAVRPADYDELDSDAGPRAAAVLNEDRKSVV